MCEEIIQRAHKIGHFAVKKTVLKLQEEYSIEKIKENLQRVMDCCAPCILDANEAGKQKGTRLTTLGNFRQLTKTANIY